jgi:hypothetical protein
MTTILLKLPRNIEVTPEAAKTFLSALTGINSVSGFQKLMGKNARPLSLEIASINQQILFLITCDSELLPFVESQIQSNYPLVVVEKIKDPIEGIPLEIKELHTARGNYYPIATYDKFTDVDPLSSVLSVFSKAEPTEVVMIQIALESTSNSWQGKGASYADMGSKNEDGSYSPRADKPIITEKVSQPGFKTTIRLISNSQRILTGLSSSFGVFTRSD